MQRILFLVFLSFTAALLSTACKKKDIAIYTPPPVNTAFYKKYLALGDSYTIGQSVGAEERFPAQALNLLFKDSLLFNAPEYIAQTGWTTGNLLNALAASPPSRTTYDFVTLLIGVNNQYQGRSQGEYSADFTLLLNKAIEYAGNRPKRVAVLSIPDWSVTPYAAGNNTALIALQIDSFNLINKQIAGAKGVHYIDITPSSRMAATDPSLTAADGLHPSGKEYAKWAGLLAGIMKVVL